MEEPSEWCLLSGFEEAHFVPALGTGATNESISPCPRVQSGKIFQSWAKEGLREDRRGREEEQRLSGFRGRAVRSYRGVLGGCLRKRRLVAHRMSALFVQGFFLPLIDK